MTMLRFLSKLKWLALIGIWGSFSGNEKFRLFYLFWLLSFLEVFSPLRSVSDNLKSLLQDLEMLFGIFIVHLKYRFKLPAINSYTPEIKYSLPFHGKWFVVNGGIDKETSHSWGLCSQRYAYDFVILNDAKTSYVGERTVLSNYLCYNEAVLAPADGVVIDAVDCYENSLIVGVGQTDCKAPDVRGNHIVIQHGKHEYSLIAHLLVGSISVKVGEKVIRGQQIARCGNSGNTSEPHIHFQIQSSKKFEYAAGLPICFQKIEKDDQLAQETYITNGQFVKNME